MLQLLVTIPRRKLSCQGPDRLTAPNGLFGY
jgi:hypothetical protein